MHTPQGDYVLFWLGGGMLFLCCWPWLFCALYALGHPRHWTLNRVIFALVLGPMAVGDIRQGRKWW